MNLFNFTPIQKHMLNAVQEKLINSLLNVDFQLPSEDVLHIRKQVHLKAKLELVNELMLDDWPDPEDSIDSPQ